MNTNVQQPADEPEFDFGDPVLNDTENDIMEQFNEPDETPPAQEPQAAPEGADGDDAPKEDAGDGKVSADEPPAQPAPRQPEQGQQEPTGRLRADQNGNLIDQTGKVVATAGRERRIFEQNDRLRRLNTSLEQEATQLRDAAKQIEQIVGMPKEHNLTPQEVHTGMQVMANFKTNPMAVAKWALQETLAMGYNLKQIVGEGADGVEMQAIARMIDQRVGPVVQQTQEQTQQQQAAANAQRQYDAFMAKHEYADQHEDAIATLMQQDNTLTPELAYWQLREFAARNQFDFTQPLGPQINARRQPAQPAPQSAPQQPPQQPRQQQPMQQPTRVAPMPAGTAPNSAPPATDPFADPSSDWEDIIADSMRAAGMN